MKGFISSVMFMLIFSSCFDQEFMQVEPEAHLNFEQELRVHVENYLIEAEKRGIDVSDRISEVQGVINEINDDNVAGTCTWHSHSPNEIVIDESFWNNASSLYREFVVFHELGHCVQDRGHREDQFTNGNCVSIMASGVGNCKTAYSTSTRDVYLDELFKPTDF